MANIKNEQNSKVHKETKGNSRHHNRSPEHYIAMGFRSGIFHVPHAKTLFSVPLWNFNFYNSYEINKKIAEWGEETSKKVPTVLNSNLGGGWQSGDLNMEDSMFSPIYHFILESMRKVSSDVMAPGNFSKENSAPTIHVTSSWLNVNPRHSYNALHDHGLAHFSGVYYVQVPKGDCGKLGLHNPSIFGYDWPAFKEKVNNIPGEMPLAEIAPVPGAIYLWRSYLKHDVTANNTDENRISLSFNIQVDMHPYHPAIKD